MVRLFQTELEHYEKIEGTTLSIDGKANRLSALIRATLGLAMQGLAAVPRFPGAHHPQPRQGDAGAGRRTAVRGLRPRRRPGPDLQLRRDRWALRGDRVPL